MKLLVINGPNLNFLGIREKGIYGTQDYQYLLDMIQNKAKETGCEIETYQSGRSCEQETAAEDEARGQLSNGQVLTVCSLSTS